MDVDRILYIFGSFTRKKDKRKSLDQSSISAGNSPLKSRPASSLNIAPRTTAYEDPPKNPNLLSIAPRTSAYEDKGKVKEWECKLCGKGLAEPRVLGCLHSFCTRCLQDLPQDGAEVWAEDGASMQLEPGESRSASGAGSAGSGYESLRHSGSDGSWDPKPRKYGIFTRKVSGQSTSYILCPVCGHETPLPLAGIAALPLNYMLLRKIQATQPDLDVLCDLCSNDSKAESRCNQCLVSICSSCGESHGRQKATSRHCLLPIDPTPPTYCTQHLRSELSIYCATCQQVICRDCCVVSHSGHAACGAARAAAERVRRIRDAAQRAMHVPEHVALATRALHAQAYEIDSEAAKVEAEIQIWAEQYRRAVEDHGRALHTAATRARQRHRQRVEETHRQLEERAKHAKEAVQFAEELLTQGKDAEVLSLSGPVLRRLELLTETPAGDPPRMELRFAPKAPACADSSLVGRLLTQAPDPACCVLRTDGFQDLRVNCQHEVTMELRDSSNERIWCGGEQVCGFFRRRDSSARPASATVSDRGDGSYGISFTPPAPGAYLLAVTLNNIPIQGSPFPCCARTAKQHPGQFHCCAFCSSGGKRDATCGCGATMPGGYKGCGHGHAGWPGTRHWSCCGSTERKSACEPRPKEHTKAKLYQFSL